MNHSTRPRSDGHRPRMVSQVAVARVRRCARSTVSRAALPGGPLHPAVIGDRIDAAHPACRKWVGQVPPGSYPYGMTVSLAIEYGMIERPAPAGVRLLDPDRVITFEQLAELAGVPLDEVLALRDTFEDAVPLDFDHPAVQAFLAEQGATS